MTPLAKVLEQLRRAKASYGVHCNKEKDFYIIQSFPNKTLFTHYFTYLGQRFPGPAQFHKYL